MSYRQYGKKHKEDCIYIILSSDFTDPTDRDWADSLLCVLRSCSLSFLKDSSLVDVLVCAESGSM